MKMKRIIFIVFLSAFVLLVMSCGGQKELRIITDRTESHLTPLIDYYTQETGTKVSAVFVDSGLLPRLEARPDEADVVITKTINLLETAKNQDLLRQYSSAKINKTVSADFRDPDNYYITTSYRARVIYYSKDRVNVDELSTYEDLASSKWKGRICIRSGYHEYNLSLFSQMAATWGLDKTRTFLEGLHENLARTPNGNDRAQVRAMYEGECDIAIANSYYMGIMLSRDDQRDWALSAKVFFPDQDGDGSFVLRSGAALTTATANKKEAVKFLEFLIDDYAQEYICNSLYAYSINDSLPLTDVNKSLGDEQENVVNGEYKANFIPLAEIEKYRSDIVDILDDINFDNK
jgi:iron(III) transport system substrate-binding protein